MRHPDVIRPAEHATYSKEKMGKTTLFESPRLLVGLNAFESGQQHAAHESRRSARRARRRSARRVEHGSVATARAGGSCSGTIEMNYAD